MYGNYYLNILGLSIFSVHIRILFFHVLIVDSPSAMLVILLLCAVLTSDSLKVAIPMTIEAARYIYTNKKTTDCRKLEPPMTYM